MKFKVLKGTPLFEKLYDIRIAMMGANNDALALTKELGGTAFYHADNFDNIAGGISGIEMKEKPKGWRLAFNGVKGAFFPKETKANKELLAKIKALPVVSKARLNAALNFERQRVGPAPRGGFFTSLCPNVIWMPEVILVEVNEKAIYTPVDGMIEITVSEFNRLSAEVVGAAG